MTKPLIIDYYSDVLCVWAWIAQRRIDELNQQLEDKIEFRYHYVDIFGDVPSKMQTQWKEKGGYNGFAKHVRQSASDFEDAPIHADTWTKVKPETSANVHLMLKAIENVHGRKISAEMALVFRTAFFKSAMDIGNLDVLKSLLETKNLDVQQITQSLNDGTAMAALMRDYKRSQQAQLKGSPSYILDGGRQTLYGNVGYRVLLANVEELLKSPENEACWC